MYRLYVDEVGTDDLTRTADEKLRYLSLTGIAMRVDYARDYLTPNTNWIKAKILDHDPDDPAILHRTDIMGRKGIFGCLSDETRCAKFDRATQRLIASSQYTVITALIDKHWMLKQHHWTKTHPYHYLMEILVEKYVQFLEREKSIGDIMPEARGKHVDGRLQRAYDQVRDAGTQYVSAERIGSAIRASKLKFRLKKENVAGLQLADLVAHPSHIYTRSLMGHEVTLGPFAKQATDMLVSSKYDRNKWGRIVGYGIKHLP